MNILELIQEIDQKNQEAMRLIELNDQAKAMQALELNYDLIETLYKLAKEQPNG